MLRVLCEVLPGQGSFVRVERWCCWVLQRGLAGGVACLLPCQLRVQWVCWGYSSQCAGCSIWCAASRDAAGWKVEAGGGAWTLAGTRQGAAHQTDGPAGRSVAAAAAVASLLQGREHGQAGARKGSVAEH
jgi:hypothetical protein